MANEIILILCGGNFPNKEIALEFAKDTLNVLTYACGEWRDGDTRGVSGYTGYRTFDDPSEKQNNWYSAVVRATSEEGKRLLKEALEDKSSWGYPIFTLRAKRIKSKKQLNEILKNGSSWFSDEDLKKVRSGEKDESSSVFIVPAQAHY